MSGLYRDEPCGCGAIPVGPDHHAPNQYGVQFCALHESAFLMFEALEAFIAAELEWQRERGADEEDCSFDDPLADALKLAKAAIEKAEVRRG